MTSAPTASGPLCSGASTARSLTWLMVLSVTSAGFGKIEPPWTTR